MMDLQTRYLQETVLQDMAEKMVWIAGPRQVGKTTLLRQVAEAKGMPSSYYNWDERDHRKDILEKSFPPGTKTVLFDELHKYPQWKTYLKGLYDTRGKELAMLVSGSARLAVFRRGGDSLFGRYRYHRLHPFSLAEMAGVDNTFLKPGSELHFPPHKQTYDSLLSTLLTFGGFPEPLLSQDSKILRRFQTERTERLVTEDIRDTTAVRDLASLELLADLLPERVGSLLSINNLREDLGVAHKTTAHWIELLEQFFLHFRIRPFASSVVRSIRKEPKLYLWDWSVVPDPALRLENLVASHLLKFVHRLHDAEGHDVRLFFLRDRAGREVDFLVTEKLKPWFAVEVKSNEIHAASGIRYFGERLRIPYQYQLTLKPHIDRLHEGVRIMNASRFLAGLT